jgi:hypothetical protein
MSSFVPPTFRKGSLEIRFDGSELAIYATPEGLQSLIGCCNKLLSTTERGRTTDHIHLEDIDLIAKSSEIKSVALAVFNDEVC